VSDKNGKDISYRDIEDLTASGINAADIARLKLAGCATVGSILMTTKKQLACIKGLSEAKIEKIVEVSAEHQQCGIQLKKECPRLQTDLWQRSLSLQRSTTSRESLYIAFRLAQEKWISSSEVSASCYLTEACDTFDTSPS